MAKKKRSQPLSAADLIAELEADPLFQREAAMREEGRVEYSRQLRAEQTPLLRDLARVGLIVDCVWDLRGLDVSHGDVIAVLCEHLRFGYSARIIEGMARALAVPAARLAWPDLLRIYHQWSDNRSEKQGVAVALSVLGSFDDLLELVSDPAHGESRVLLLEGLVKKDRDRAKAVLLMYRSDPVLGVQAETLLKQIAES